MPSPAEKPMIPMRRGTMCLLLLAACAGPELSFEDAPERLILLPDADDDLGNGKADWRKSGGDGEDIASLVVPAESFRGIGRSETLILALPEGTRGIRVWHEGEEVLSGSETSWEVAWTRGEDLELGVQARDPGIEAALVLRHESASGEVVREISLRVSSAPLVLAHHLRPAEHVWVMDVEDGVSAYNNQHMVSVYAEVLGDDVTFVDQFQHQFDVWVQDELQIGSVVSEQGRIDYVLDSIRDGGLDPLPKSLLGPDVAVETWGTQGEQSTYDSFGNLEVSPPVTVDGVEYPYGRIYLGNRDRFGPHSGLISFLQEQRIQAPIELDTSWLCVGHVDEYMSFLPDPTAPKGYRVALADPVLGLELLDSMDPATALPRYARGNTDEGHGRPTVGSIVSDAGFRATNGEVVELHLDPLRAQLKAELGLTDEDFISVPLVFEEVPGCFIESGVVGVAAMTPGMVNLVVLERDGVTDVFLADPFVRDEDTPVNQDADPFIAAVRERMPQHLQLHFVDNWFVYHMGLGEVHCGTNELRTPQSGWWQDAAHLISETP